MTARGPPRSIGRMSRSFGTEHPRRAAWRVVRGERPNWAPNPSPGRSRLRPGTHARARRGGAVWGGDAYQGLGTLLGRARGAASERGGHEDDDDDEGEEDDDEYSGDDTSAGGAPAAPRAAANGTGSGVENVDGFMIEQCGGEEVFGVPVTGLTSCNACAEPPRRADSVTQTTAGSSGDCMATRRGRRRSLTCSCTLRAAVVSSNATTSTSDALSQNSSVPSRSGPGLSFAPRLAEHDTFVACGSDDACVHLWRRSHAGLPVASLRGHAGTVNMVAWRPPREPTQPPLLASVSDDHTVILWSSCEAE